MCRSKVVTLAACLVTLCVPVVAGAADTASPLSAFSTSVADPSEFTIAPRTAPRFEAVRYRPRRGPFQQPAYGAHEQESHIRGVTQLHAGFLDPNGPANAGFLLGFRGGQQIDQMFELGLGIDWRSKSGHQTEVLSETTGPGGERIVVSRELSRYSSHLFPLLAYFQLSAPSGVGIQPYGGIAGTYQALFLSAEDSVTGEAFDATYDGWGWQAWGGVGIPLAERSKFIGEVFWNDAVLGRDVHDPLTGGTYRETVDMNGIGGRLGFSWAF